MQKYKSKIVEKSTRLSKSARAIVDEAVAKALRDATKTPVEKTAPKALGPLAQAHAMKGMTALQVLAQRSDRSDQPADAEIREYGGGILGLLRARHAREH